MYKKFLSLIIGLNAGLISINVNAQASETAQINNNNQAKIIIYRGNTHKFAYSKNAKLYLDDKYITNISKHDYIEFCTTPDKHKITSHLENVLIYSEKNKKHLVNELTAGSTYLIRINDDENAKGELVEVNDEANIKELIKNKSLKIILPNEKNNILECKQFLETHQPIANAVQEPNMVIDDKNVNSNSGSNFPSEPSAENTNINFIPEHTTSAVKTSIDNETETKSSVQ